MHSNEESLSGNYYPVRTARQKNRLRKKDEEKQLIRLHRLENELQLQRRSLPLISLETPYQKGWKRSFVPCEDVARSSTADFYRNLLKKINTVEYSADKAFIRKKRRRKKVYEVRPQHPRAFRTRKWSHPESKLTDAEKAQFHLRQSWSRDGKTMILEYVFTEPWRFVLRTRPFMITHVRQIDEAPEQRIQELDNYIEEGTSARA